MLSHSVCSSYMDNINDTNHYVMQLCSSYVLSNYVHHHNMLFINAFT